MITEQLNSFIHIKIFIAEKKDRIQTLFSQLYKYRAR